MYYPIVFVVTAKHGMAREDLRPGPDPIAAPIMLSEDLDEN